MRFASDAARLHRAAFVPVASWRRSPSRQVRVRAVPCCPLSSRRNWHLTFRSWKFSNASAEGEWARSILQAGTTTDYDFNITADGEDGGHPGYDLLTVPEVNAAKSDASCTVSSSAQGAKTPGIGGTDTSIYRTLHVHQDKGTTCVIDWAELNRPRVTKALEMLDTQLRAQPFIAGQRFTVADITAIMAMQMMDTIQVAVPQEFAALQRWRMAALSRPGVVSVIGPRKAATA